MNEEDIKKLQDSFSKIYARKEEVAEAFYNRLFEIAPGVRPLFKDDMQGQQQKFIASVHKIVQALKTQKDLVDYCRALGEAHIGYGAETSHYPVVGENLIHTFKTALGDEFTPELEKLWTAAYQTVAETMIEISEKARATV